MLAPSIQVHPSDVASVALTYGGFKPKQFPATPGIEAVGRVEQSGPGAGKFPKGTRVIALSWGTMHGEGTWQQYAVVPEAALVPVPDGVPEETAAQAIVNPGACMHAAMAPHSLVSRVSACMETRGCQSAEVAKRWMLAISWVTKADVLPARPVGLAVGQTSASTLS